MRLLFLCLLAGEIGLGFFGYYGQVMYHDGSYAWIGFSYAILPLLLVLTESENNDSFQDLVRNELSEINICEIIFTGNFCAFAYCRECGLLYIVTPGDADQATVTLRSMPVENIQSVAFRETLTGWQVHINEQYIYPLRPSGFLALKVSRWEEFFIGINSQVSITYDDNFHYWFSRSLGVTVFIPGMLVVLLAFS